MNSSKLRIITPLVVLGTVAAIGFLIVNLLSGSKAGLKGTHDVGGQSLIPTPAAEKVVLYPGAKLQQTEPRYVVPLATVTTYTALGSVVDVAKFYGEALQKEGWVDANDFSSDKSHQYIWGDRTGAAAWGLYIDITLSEELNAEKQKQVYAVIWLRRIPDWRKVPLYADARQVEFKKRSNNAFTYITTAQPSEIERYYRAIMPQYAWYSPEPEETDITKGISFTFHFGGPTRGLNTA